MAIRKRIPFRIFWSALMTLTYIGIAYLAIFTPAIIRYNDANDPTDDQHFLIRMLFGIMVFVYGIARGYRTYKQLRADLF
jgi:uncharacterized membrane protein HdeD (DUF308 family)